MTHPEWVSLEIGPGCHSQRRQSWFLLTDKVIMADSPCPKEEMVVTVTNARSVIAYPAEQQERYLEHRWNHKNKARREMARVKQK